ncbi:hypothetical protein B0H14DRAFT_3463782 [Mycena olivaceomarginata]|nr:hypothetical protein B0H14DRAFT_3463782 [Mycena olivaceomarginata]
MLRIASAPSIGLSESKSLKNGKDQADEDPSERGRALVSSADGWRVEMARWISAAREDAAEDEEGDEAEEDTPVLPECLTQEEEESYMRVMAELDGVDDSLDDGEVEIDESEVYGD